MSLLKREKYYWFKPGNRKMHKVYDTISSTITHQKNIIKNTYIKKTCGKENCKCKCNERNKEKDNS